jgi:PAS domain S-box-containing protein
MFDARNFRRFISPATQENDTAALRKFYAIAVGLMGCFMICMQLLIGSLANIQERETYAVKVAGQEQLLGEQSARAATEMLAQGAASPEATSRLITLLEAWTACRQKLGAGLGFQSRPASLPASDVSILVSAVKHSLTSEEGGFSSNEGLALAKAVVEAQPRLLASSSELVEMRLASALAAKSELRNTSLIVGAVMVIVLGIQTWRGFGEALRLLGAQRSRETLMLNEVQLARDTISRMTRRQELILNSAGEAIWGVDEQGLTTFVNPAATKLTLWQGDELLGRSQHETLRHSDANGQLFDAEACPICRAVRDGHVHQASNDTFYRQDGTCFPVEYHSTPIREGGQIVGAVLTFKDIGENRALQSKLMQAQKLESIGQLAAGIAHEINTPTQYVSDNTRFLKDSFAGISKLLPVCQQLVEAAAREQLGPELIQESQSAFQAADLEYLLAEVPKAIDESLDGLSRVSRIVGAMKEFSHPDGDAKALTDINRAIESTVTVARNEWKYVADVDLQLDPSLPLVSCLAGSFNQVILNLVVNAAHAIADVAQDTQQKGKITITTSRKADGVAISIGDSGKGIPAAIRARVFDPFFTTKPVGKGTGQGLAIAYSVVVEKHGGSISFESEEGRGTTFHIYLPNQTSAVDEEAARETADCAG